jgi:hypothetical protein
VYVHDIVIPVLWFTFCDHVERPLCILGMESVVGSAVELICLDIQWYGDVGASHVLRWSTANARNMWDVPMCPEAREIHRITTIALQSYMEEFGRMVGRLRGNADDQLV